MPQRNRRTGRAGVLSIGGRGVGRCVSVSKSDLDRLGSGVGGSIGRLGMGHYSGISRTVDEMSLGRFLINEMEDLQSELTAIKKNLSEMKGE